MDGELGGVRCVQGDWHPNSPGRKGYSASAGAAGVGNGLGVRCKNYGRQGAMPHRADALARHGRMGRRGATPRRPIPKM